MFYGSSEFICFPLFCCSFVYKLTDFGAARELAPEQLFVSIYGTEEYLVMLFNSYTGILAVGKFFYQMFFYHGQENTERINFQYSQTKKIREVFQSLEFRICQNDKF